MMDPIRRLWGTYQVLHITPTSKTKELIVDPGKGTSLQRHFERSEHWVVTQGLATVHLDGKEYVLDQDESVYIPKGAWHRLSNFNKGSKLHVIEVQYGKCFEEDIERFAELKEAA